MSLLSQSWPIAKKNGLFLTAYLITVIAVVMLISTIETLSSPFPILKIGSWIVYTLLIIIISQSVINYSLQAVRGEELSFPRWKSILHFVPNYVIGSCLLSLTAFPTIITSYTINPETVLNNNFEGFVPNLSFLISAVVSTVLYIGVYIRLGFYIFILVDQPKRFDRALIQSWELTKGNSKRIVLFGLLCAGLNILGLLLLVVGIFPATILCYLIAATLYNNMLQAQPSKTAE